MSALAEVTIVHRDAHLLVVAKPSGLSTTSPDPSADCLVRRVARLDPKAPRLHPTSRLDAEVSGLVTFARTQRATKALLEARRQGLYRRRYLALTLTRPEVGEWAWPIGQHPRDRRLRATEGRGAKAARTWSVVAAEAPLGVLLALDPETGRTHQLRVHAQAAGAPLFGDVHYGGARRTVQQDGRVVSLRRCALHCARLVLPPVAGGGELDLRLAPPADFQAAWLGMGGDLSSLDRALALRPAGR